MGKIYRGILILTIYLNSSKSRNFEVRHICGFWRQIIDFTTCYLYRRNVALFLHFPEIALSISRAAISAADYNPHRYGHGIPGVQKEEAPSRFTGEIQKLTESKMEAQHS